MNTKHSEGEPTRKHCFVCVRTTNHFDTTCLNCGYSGIADKLAHVVNTPDTELLKTIKEIGIATYGGVDFEPTGMYRDKLTVILKSLLTARDTYWKERVRKECCTSCKNMLLLLNESDTK